MMPCVILASQPRDDAPAGDVEAFRDEYFDFVPGTHRSRPVAVHLRDAGDQDGGNGSGIEPGGAAMNPAIGTLGKSVWDFAAYPENANRDVRFPRPMRFELCLLFNDIGQAHNFLAQEEAGARICRIFHFVEIVALSTPAYAPMPGKAAVYA